LAAYGITSLDPDRRISAHSPKKGMVDLANQNPAIKTTWLAFRAGWVLKCIHTIFDYLICNAANDR